MTEICPICKADILSTSQPDQPVSMRDALERSVVAIDDWLQTYAAELCDPARVEEASKRIGEYGTLSYIASVQEQNRAALDASTSQPNRMGTTPEMQKMYDEFGEKALMTSDPAPEPCSDLSISELLEWLWNPQWTNGFLDSYAEHHMSAAAKLLEKLLGVPAALAAAPAVGPSRCLVCGSEISACACFSIERTTPAVATSTHEPAVATAVEDPRSAPAGYNKGSERGPCPATPAVGGEGLPSEAFSRKVVGQAMLDAWNEICSDIDCHPLDITHKGKKLYFDPAHWADLTARLLFVNAIKLSLAQPASPLRGRDPRCPHDMGFDNEIGPLGCRLVGQEMECVCEHMHFAASPPEQPAADPYPSFAERNLIDRFGRHLKEQPAADPDKKTT